MSAVDAHGTVLDGSDGLIYGVFDKDDGDFIKAFTRLADAEDYVAILEVPRFTRWPRFSVDQLPVDHPLAEDFRP